MVKIYSLDKEWLSPQLKQLHRQIQGFFIEIEIVKSINQQKAKFRKIKRKSVILQEICDRFKSTRPKTMV